jgi:hypothetical protein
MDVSDGGTGLSPPLLLKFPTPPKKAKGLAQLFNVDINLFHNIYGYLDSTP